jgi:hypothetical protein
MGRRLLRSRTLGLVTPPEPPRKRRVAALSAGRAGRGRSGLGATGGLWKADGAELSGTADADGALLVAPPVEGDADFHLESFIGESGRARFDWCSPPARGFRTD